MAKPVYILNGPNLNMLGRREPGIYGGGTLDDIGRLCEETGRSLGFTVEFRQSNHEGVLVDWIQEAGDKAEGLIINPGAYSHTSIAIHDAIRAVQPLPAIEVHLSNIHAREAFRHVSRISPVVIGVVAGFGAASYAMALHGLAAKRKDAQERQ